MANTYIKRVNDSNFRKIYDIAFLTFNSKQIKCHLHTRIQGNKCSLLDSSSSHHHPHSSSRYLAMWSHDTESKNRLNNLVWHKTIQTTVIMSPLVIDTERYRSASALCSWCYFPGQTMNTIKRTKKL